MSLYIQTLKITYEEIMTYRLNFLFWRFRSLLYFLTLFFFWTAMFSHQNSIFGYSQSQMLTYVVGIAFLRSVVLGSRTGDIPGLIRDGTLTKFLIQPLPLYRFWFSRDLLDKSLNLFFTIFEIALVMVLFRFPFYFPTEPTTYFLFIIFCILSAILYFYLSLFLSFVGFWTEEVWATRWLFGFIFLEFLAGSFFPLDVMPPLFQKIVSFTPFPYLIFYPLKLWLGQLSQQQTFYAMGICIIWTVIFLFLSRMLWNKGTKNYGAYGG